MSIKLHTFVYTNIKEFNESTGTTPKHFNGTEIHRKLQAYLKDLVEKAVLSQQQFKTIRINKSGCLGKCGKGPIMLTYSNKSEHSFSQDWEFYNTFDDAKAALNHQIYDAMGIKISG